MKQNRLIDQIGGDERGGKRRAALDHQPGDALRGKKFEPVHEDRGGRRFPATRNTSTPSGSKTNSAASGAAMPATAQTGVS